jgi:N-acetylmuramoyl-L-alanine amidase
MAARGPAAVLMALLLGGCAPESTVPHSPAPSSLTAVAVASATPRGSASPSASRSTATPSASPTAANPLAGRTIVIDPGHNGGWTAKYGYQKVPDGNGHLKACNSSGTATRGGYSEHAYDWAQAKALAEVLRKRGATVRLTRSSDRGQGPCVDRRATLANALHADLLISIHADGNTGKTHRGFHVIMSPVMHGGKAVYAKSKKLAADVRAAVQHGAGMPRSNYIGGGTAFSVRSDLGTLNFAKVPAVMMEMGNMMNAADAKLFISSSWRARTATALADGIQKFLG